MVVFGLQLYLFQYLHHAVRFPTHKCDRRACFGCREVLPYLAYYDRGDGDFEQGLGYIFEYALNKFNDYIEKFAAGRPKFLSVIDRFVTAETRVEMCLPAFPFKSANKVEKVFGILPDKAEELALERLNTMCMRIEDVYPPGAKLTIISDGLVYNGSSSINQAISLTLRRLLM